MRHFLNSVLFGGALWALVGIASPVGAAELPLDAPIPPGSEAAHEFNRFRTSRSYEEVLDFYRRLFHSTGGVRYRSIVNQPGLRARHIESLRPKTRWSGINVSEHHGDVGIYVLMRPPTRADKGAEARRN